MRTTPLWHGHRRVLSRAALLLATSLAISVAPLGSSLAVAAAGPSVVAQSANDWTDFLGSTRILHLIANVQNQDAQRDASLVAVSFDLWNTSNGLVGQATADTGGLNIVTHAGGTTLAFTHAGDLLATTDWGGDTRFWEPHSGFLVFKADTSLANLQFSRDDRYLVFVGLADHLTATNHKLIIRAVEHRRLFAGGTHVDNAIMISHLRH